jgi:hypothetical protein
MSYFRLAKEGMGHYYARDSLALEQLLNHLEHHMEKSIVLSIARVAQDLNHAYCQAIGDTGSCSWEDAPNWQRDSVCRGVEMHLANPDTTPEQSHAAWMDLKLREGWRFGEVKDGNAKTHPCLVPYDQLPAEQRVKDHLFRGIVRSIAREMARP